MKILHNSKLLQLLAVPYRDHFHRNPLLARETGIGYGPLWRSPMLWALVLVAAGAFADVARTAWMVDNYAERFGILVFRIPFSTEMTLLAVRLVAALFPIWCIARGWEADSSSGMRSTIAASPLTARQLIGAKILVWIIAPMLLGLLLSVPADLWKAQIIYNSPRPTTEFFINSHIHINVTIVDEFGALASTLETPGNRLKESLMDVLRKTFVYSISGVASHMLKALPFLFFAAGLVTRATLYRFSAAIGFAVFLIVTVILLSGLVYAGVGESGIIFFFSFFALLLWWNLPKRIKRAYGMSES